jgi:hypothetical protein
MMMNELETPRLLLRKLRLDDANDMYEYAQDHEIALNGLWLPFASLQESIDDITETLECMPHATCSIGRLNIGRIAK